MYKLRQILLTAFANFRRWKKNPQIILAFCLAFIVSFLLSDKVLVFAKEHDTILQMAEPFIWTFGDAQSVLIISLLLLLLFADMPNLGNDVPLFLVRIDRMPCAAAAETVRCCVRSIILRRTPAHWRSGMHFMQSSSRCLQGW